MGTLMRHFLCAPPASAPLALGMVPATTPAALVAFAGRAHRIGPCRPGAVAAAIAVAAVAARADADRAPTAGAVEKTGGSLHRQLLPKRVDPEDLGLVHGGASLG